MRSTKLVSAFAALVIALSLTGLVASPAQAAKPKHDLSGVGGYTTPKGQFVIEGKITTLLNKNVTVEKKPKGKNWGFYSKTKTSGKGKFSTFIDGKIGDCFRVVAPETSEYKETKRKIGCIVPQ